MSKTVGGATRSNTEDQGAGLSGTVLGRTAGGATKSNTEDRGAGPGGKVLGRTAEGATRSNTDKVVRSIKGGGRRATRWVKVNLGGEELNLYCDTGSNITIITPMMFKDSMGKLEAAKSNLRAWGSTDYLDTKGMFKTTLTTASGATKRTWVYVVAGARPEPLLGDHNAEDLGIVSFNPDGRAPKEEKEIGGHKDVNKISIPARLRQAGKRVITERPPLRKVETKGKE